MTHPSALPGTSPDTMDSPRPTTTSAYTSSGDPADTHHICIEQCKLTAYAWMSQASAGNPCEEWALSSWAVAAVCQHAIQHPRKQVDQSWTALRFDACKLRNKKQGGHLWRGCGCG